MGGLFGEYSDPEDDEEAELAAKRPKEKVEAWGEGDSALGQDREDEIKAMARSHAELAIRTLADVAANGVKDAARNTAATQLLNRGFGAVTRKVEQKVDVKISDQRAAHFAALQEMARKNPAVQIEDAEFEEVEPKRLGKRKVEDDGE